MNNLTVFEQNGQLLTDSREVAMMVGKDHAKLLRDIKGYVKHLTEANFGLSEYFIESEYKDSTGRTLTSSSLEDTVCPDRIKDFTPAEIGGNRYITGTYHGYFDEDMITIITPVTNSYFVKGYLLIHKPVSHLDEECKTL